MEASNVKAMREALEIAEYLLCAKGLFKESKQMTAALSAPPRNCDVGTPEDQHNRFMRFCDSKSMGYCWGRGCRKCMAQWGQMPYEEGELK